MTAQGALHVLWNHGKTNKGDDRNQDQSDLLFYVICRASLCPTMLSSRCPGFPVAFPHLLTGTAHEEAMRSPPVRTFAILFCLDTGVSVKVTWCLFVSSLPECLSFCSYASDVTSGLSDGNEGQSEKGNREVDKRATTKQFRRRTRARLEMTGVKNLICHHRHCRYRQGCGMFMHCVGVCVCPGVRHGGPCG